MTSARRFSSTVVAALALGALGAVPGARANEVLVMRNGSRLEVVEALPSGDDLHCRLPGGGTIVVAQTAVKRVSRMAGDMPAARPSLVTASVGGVPGPGMDAARGGVSSAPSRRLDVARQADVPVSASMGSMGSVDFAVRRAAVEDGAAAAEPRPAGKASSSRRPPAKSAEERKAAQFAALQKALTPTPENMRRLLTRVGNRSGGGARSMQAPGSSGLGGFSELPPKLR